MVQKITGKLIKSAIGLLLPDVYYGNTLGLVGDYSDNKETELITFLDDEKYVRKVNKNKNVKSIFTTSTIWNKLDKSDIQPIFCDDPRFYFYSLHNYISRGNYKKEPSIIADSANIHFSSYVSDYNVVIGENTIVEPNVTILHDVKIGNNVIIRAGAVIGSEGFEHKRTTKGVLSVFHSGKVVIYDNVEIGANTCIDKGFIKNTIIEAEVKIDNLVHVGHSVKIGKKSLITAGVIIAGSVEIGENVWLSLGVIVLNNVHIGDNSFVGTHSLVIRNVKDNARVYGIPAISLGPE
ncbi:MAG TPA: UDP-3-O-(3-hydroxymyristoyl)glucosamine N-acyltransferase [Ignavibacteria bacterium]